MKFENILKKVKIKLASHASEYIRKGDITQDSEEALEHYQNALQCSDITPSQKKECEKNIKEIKIRNN